MMKRVVPPEGPLDARLVCVGRDPGSEEMAAGRPFVGEAGRVRDRAFAQAGLSRHTMLTTNVVQTQPPGNEWSRHDPQDITEGAEACLALVAHHPRALVVALGQQAAALCISGDPCGKLPAPITELRGYVFPSSACGAPVLCTVHPAFILRTWHPWWATFCWDAEKAARLVARGITQPTRTVTILKGRQDVLRFQERAATASIIACDIETSGLGCIGFSIDEREGVVIAGQPSTAHPLAVEVQAILTLDVPFVFCNGQFDVTIMQRVGWQVRRWDWDVQLMWHAFAPLLAGQREDARGTGKRRTEKSLRFLASLLIDDATYWKSYEFATDEDQQRLCALDCMHTLSIWRTLKTRLEAA